MAPRRKRPYIRKEVDNRHDLRPKTKGSASALLSEPKEICSTVNSMREAECSRHFGFEGKRGRKKSTWNLDTIPEEVLLQILSFFTPLQLVRFIGPACRRTLEFSRYPELWRRLKLDNALEPPPSPGGAQPPNPGLPTVASRLLSMAGTHLHVLEIADRRDAASLVEQATAVGGSPPPQLRSLIIRRIPGPFPAKVLLRALRKFPGIRKLVLNDIRRLRSRVFFQDLGSKLPHLSHLDVSHCPQFGTSALAAVATSGLALRELMAFRERGYRSTMPHATDEDFSLFCAHMKDSIEVIKINAIALTDESCKMLVKCIHLTTLHLRDARGFSARGILKIVRHLTQLISLDLSGAILLSSGNWAEIFANMVAAPRLQVLKLAGCFGIDDFSAEHMNFPALRHLSLGGCFLLGEAGFCAIITRCNNLCHLDLEGTGPALCSCLHLIPVYTPKLEMLVFPLSNCPIDFWAQLLLKMKHLKLCDRNEPERVQFWRDVAVEDELRRLNENQVAQM
ncbi:F-box/LRR-repeat protein 7-like [Hetaerina americana]|uniref:F-box/LRR-repeat protein 7-like n=1 Tax=Hetaerina americana TaxID=62018 RepID=UPI003A7F3119